MYSGGICGSPRLLHRGFQAFRGLMMGTAGWSTTARVASTTIREPRAKRTAGKAKSDGKEDANHTFISIALLSSR